MELTEDGCRGEPNNGEPQRGKQLAFVEAGSVSTELLLTSREQTEPRSHLTG